MGEGSGGAAAAAALQEWRSQVAELLGRGEMSELARSVAAQRRALKTEEQLLRQREAALDVAGLQGFVKAKEEAERLHAQAQALVARRAGALHRAEKLQAERHRRDAAALRAIGDAMRATFRALCARGDASLEYGASGPTLFEAGVSVHAKPPASEWVRFEQLSGGQQALVAVALQLACQEALASSPFCIFDEIDAALDTQRTQALATHVAARSTQSIFVSHRPQLIDASSLLVGTYLLGGASSSVVAAF